MLKSQSSSAPTGIREFLRQHPLYVVVPLFIAVVITLCFSLRPPPPPNAYFTIDDGTTFFVAPIQVPPFTYQGKEAVQCMMFTADGGASKFIGYLLRYTPNSREKMQARLSDANPAQGMIPSEWTEVKKPGKGTWVKGVAMSFGPAAAFAPPGSYNDVVAVTGPHGTPAFPVGAN